MWNIVLSDQSIEDTVKEIKSYHESNIKQAEDDRYSEKSAQAFEFLRNTTKYHCFDKKEGSIVSSVKDNDQIISDPDRVAKLIIDHYKEVHKDPLFDDKKPKIRFPQMKKLNKEEILHIMEKMSYEKAIAYDGLSDHMFNIHNRCRGSEKKLCEDCEHKITIIRNLFEPKYWNSERSNIHF